MVSYRFLCGAAITAIHCVREDILEKPLQNISTSDSRGGYALEVFVCPRVRHSREDVGEGKGLQQQACVEALSTNSSKAAVHAHQPGKIEGNPCVHSTVLIQTFDDSYCVCAPHPRIPSANAHAVSSSWISEIFTPSSVTVAMWCCNPRQHLDGRWGGGKENRPCLNSAHRGERVHAYIRSGCDAPRPLCPSTAARRSGGATPYPVASEGAV